MFIIGIDIGGMSIKVGLVDKDGKIIAKNRKVTAKTADECITGMVEQIDALLNENHLTVKDLLGIGIGCPGLINSKDGIVISNCNMGWDNVDIVNRLNKIYNIPVKLSNDANVAALGEVVFGSAKNYDDAVMLTLGTGVGGGIVIEKKLYEGGNSLGAEMGHVTIVSGGELCGCGRKGCLEAYASASALIRQTKEAMMVDKESSMWQFVNGDINAVDGRTAFECSKEGDKSANIVVNNFVTYLSDGILSILNIFRPQVIIIGGGISAQGDYLVNKIVEYCKKYKYGYDGAPKSDIVTATLGNDAGIIGAASLIV